MPIQLNDLVNNRPLNTAVKKPINLYLGLAKEKVAQYDQGAQSTDIAQLALDSKKRLEWRNPQYQEKIAPYQSKLDAMVNEGHYEKYGRDAVKVAREFSNDDILKAMEQEYAHYNEYSQDIREKVNEGKYSSEMASRAMALSKYSSQNPLEKDEFGNVKNKFSGIQMKEIVNGREMVDNLFTKLKADQIEGRVPSDIALKYKLQSLKGISPEKLRDIATEMVENDPKLKEYMQWEADLTAKSFMYDENGQPKDFKQSDLQSMNITNSQGQVLLPPQYKKDESGDFVLDENGQPIIERLVDERSTQSLQGENGQVNQDYAFQLIKRNLYDANKNKLGNYASKLAYKQSDISYINDTAAELDLKFRNDKRIADYEQSLITEKALVPYSDNYAEYEQTGETRLDDKGIEALTKNGMDLSGSMVITNKLKKNPKYEAFMKELKDKDLGPSELPVIFDLKKAINAKDNVNFGEFISMMWNRDRKLIDIPTKNELNKLETKVSENDIKIYNDKINQIKAKYGEEKVNDILDIVTSKSDKDVKDILNILSQGAFVVPTLGASNKVTGQKGNNVRRIGNKPHLALQVDGYDLTYLQQQIEAQDGGAAAYKTAMEEGSITSFDGKTGGLKITKPYDFTGEQALIYDQAIVPAKALEPKKSVESFNSNQDAVYSINKAAKESDNYYYRVQHRINTHKEKINKLDINSQNDLTTLNSNLDKSRQKVTEATNVSEKQVALKVFNQDLKYLEIALNYLENQ